MFAITKSVLFRQKALKLMNRFPILPIIQKISDIKGHQTRKRSISSTIRINDKRAILRKILPSQITTYDVVFVRAGKLDQEQSLVQMNQFQDSILNFSAYQDINAALSKMTEDDIKKIKIFICMYDTIKGSDWLGDQDAISYMLNQAPKASYELESYRLTFFCIPEGQIYLIVFMKQVDILIDVVHYHILLGNAKIHILFS